MISESIYITDDREDDKELNEKKRLSSEFLLSVGFDEQKYSTESEKKNILNLTWLIFDKYGNIKGLKTCGCGLIERNGVKCDFRDVEGDNENDPDIMINWLRKNNLYGHRLCSFFNRHIEFYRMNFLGKLEWLEWEVSNGELINTTW